MPLKIKHIWFLKKIRLAVFSYLSFLFLFGSKISYKKNNDDTTRIIYDKDLCLRDIETIQYDLSNYIFRQPKYCEYLKLKDPKM